MKYEELSAYLRANSGRLDDSQNTAIIDELSRRLGQMGVEGGQIFPRVSFGRGRVDFIDIASLSRDELVLVAFEIIKKGGRGQSKYKSEIDYRLRKAYDHFMEFETIPRMIRTYRLEGATSFQHEELDRPLEDLLRLARSGELPRLEK
ncbi:MAG TPA: hypothetical protein VJI97_02385 [Candidatus Nanoarchaeia archaeon]|nr:hypothetical protein [Candidatus Nanoarchaeia archaeon]